MDVVQKRKEDNTYCLAFDTAKGYFEQNEMEIPDFNPASSVCGSTEFSNLFEFGLDDGKAGTGKVLQITDTLDFTVVLLTVLSCKCKMQRYCSCRL